MDEIIVGFFIFMFVNFCESCYSFKDIYVYVCEFVVNDFFIYFLIIVIRKCILMYIFMI